MIDIPRRAQNDMDDAAEEIDDHSGPAAAARFNDDLIALLARLAGSPRMYAEVDPPYRKFPGMRVAPVPGGSNRLVFYQPIPGGIRVVRVLHGRMDFNAVFR